MEIPQDASGSDRLALDLDGDGFGDNKLGQWLTVLRNVITDPQGEMDMAIAAGTLIQLHRVHADDFTSDSTVLWQIYEGENTAPELPDYTGSGTFSISALGPTDDIVRGGVAGGNFTGGPGTATLRLPVTQPAFALHLIGVRIYASITTTMTATNASGQLGGGLTVAALDSDIVPGVIDLLTAECAIDCTGLICSDVDTDQNCAISISEFQANAFFSSLFAPDLDLLDANGDFNPNSDGVNDSLSIGVRFTAVGATFDAPCPTNE